MKNIRNLKGVGTDEKTVIEILCTKDGVELQKLKEAYKSGNLIKLINSINLNIIYILI